MESKGDGLGGEGEEQGANPRRHFIAHSGALAASALMGMVAALAYLMLGASSIRRPIAGWWRT